MHESRGGKTLQDYFSAAMKANALVEVHIKHPKASYQRQVGLCYSAEAEYLVMGPEGAPERVCIPYTGLRWFRRMDDVI